MLGGFARSYADRAFSRSPVWTHRLSPVCFGFGFGHACDFATPFGCATAAVVWSLPFLFSSRDAPHFCSRFFQSSGSLPFMRRRARYPEPLALSVPPIG